MIDDAPSDDQAIVFAPFSLLTQQQLLLENGKPVGLGSRALQILTVLASRAGDVVSKDDLIAQVWPGIFVEEATLRVHIAALRRALGDGHTGRRFIVTTPGRGYSLVAPVSRSAERPRAGRQEPSRSALPALLTRMVGREAVVQLLSAQLRERRLISIVGPGGIGKTSVALAVADAARPLYQDGIHFLDLGPIADPQLVPSALAAVLGLPIDTDDPLPRLIAAMHEREMLLVLDCCEHVIDAAAALAKEVLRATTRVRILATSREALRVEGERVQRLSPLEVPPRVNGITAAQALSFPAVELFVERVLSTADTFELTDADAPTVAEICRRLDGIALAIELAATRVVAFGVRGVAARLDDRFRLLTGGHRTAFPRHRTLAATMDWSYQLLPELERVVLQRLAILAGSFTLTSAAAVAAGGEIDASDAVDHVANLVSKSLVSADIASEAVFYRLLDTTRAYARGKLIESGEFDRIARQHAEYFCNFFMRAEAELTTSAAAEWAATYSRRLDNARAALDWAFSPGGDRSLGIALTIAVAPVWSHLLLNEECRSRVEIALSSLEPTERAQDRSAMRLFAVLASTFLFGPEGSKAWTSTLEIAEKLQDIDYQLRALRGSWANALNAGDTRSARAFAEKFSAVAATSARATDALVADRLLAQVLYLRGDLRQARTRLERVLSGHRLIGGRLDTFRFQFDQLVIAHCYSSRILWLHGLPDQAMRMAESAAEEAKAIDSTISLNYALANAACPIALNNGQLDAAERFLTMLVERAPRDPMRPWELWGRCWKGVLLVRRGDVSGAQVIATALELVPKDYFHMRYTSFLRHLADAWRRAGELPKASAAIDKALDISERHEERWSFAELLRVKGEILLHEGTPDSVAAAERHFLQSLDWARRQEALSWELRTAMSLARLWRDQGRKRAAHECLVPVYARFTEGFSTSDLVAARALRDVLR